MEPRGCPSRRGAARASPWAPGPYCAAGAWERPQGLDSPYANGAYGSAYPPAPPYPPFGAEPPAAYRPPSPAAPWSCGPADAPAEGCSAGRHRGAGCSPAPGGDPGRSGDPGWSSDPRWGGDPGRSGDPGRGGDPGWSGNLRWSSDPSRSGDPGRSGDLRWNGDPGRSDNPRWSSDPSRSGDPGRSGDLRWNGDPGRSDNPRWSSDPSRSGDPGRSDNPRWNGDPGRSDSPRWSGDPGRSGDPRWSGDPGRSDNPRWSSDPDGHRLGFETPGMPVPQFPYGEAAGGAAPHGPVPQPRPQEEPWAPCAGYGMQPRYPAHGNPFVSEPHPSWSGSGIPPCPLSHDPKDSAYEQPEQSGADLQSRYPDVTHRHPGTVSDPKPPPLHAKAAPSVPKVQYSAQPHMYGARKPSDSHQEAGFRAGDPSSTNSTAIPPEIQRILRVTEQAEQLEQEVDEFVGKKTEKSYRLLEEMLTKLLLELDSIETGGQDSVRQARKEAVHRIQAILEKLERKGL